MLYSPPPFGDAVLIKNKNKKSQILGPFEHLKAERPTFSTRIRSFVGQVYLSSLCVFPLVLSSFKPSTLFAFLCISFLFLSSFTFSVLHPILILSLPLPYLIFNPGLILPILLYISPSSFAPHIFPTHLPISLITLSPYTSLIPPPPSSFSPTLPHHSSPPHPPYRTPTSISPTFPLPPNTTPTFPPSSPPSH